MFLKKSGFVLAVAALLVPLTAGGQSGAEKLHGTWISKVERLEFTFGPKNIVTLRTGKITGKGTYFVDWSKSPAPLDITWENARPEKWIIELRGDKLQFESSPSPGGPRPSALRNPVTLQRMGSAQPVQIPSAGAQPSKAQTLSVGSSRSVIGKWQFDKKASSPDPFHQDKGTVEFRKDGKFFVEGMDTGYTWKIDEGRMKLQVQSVYMPGGRREYTYRIDGDRLTLAISKNVFVYNRFIAKKR